MIIKDSIFEYDIQHAGVAILYVRGILSEEEYTRMINLPKKQRVIQTGLLRRDNKEYTQIINDGYKEYIEKFRKKNDVKDHNVFEINHDAIWIIGREPIHTKFGNVVFKKKQEYTSLFKYHKNYYIYINTFKGTIKTRGFHTENKKFLNVIKRILQKNEYEEDLYKTLHGYLYRLNKDPLYYGENIISSNYSNVKIIKRLIKDLL